MQKSLFPVFLRIAEFRGVFLMSRIHGKQMSDGKFGKVFTHLCRQFVGEKADDLVRQVEFALSYGKSHGSRCESLAYGI